MADINGDGLPDLIVANSGGMTLTVLTNQGAGHFGNFAALEVDEPAVRGGGGCQW